METYSRVRVIGEGSFGRALLVCCKDTQEKYVLKEIQLPKNRSKMENSRREAVLLSRMKHPNIVAFRESFEADDLLCIVMEFCSGGDLLQRIQLQKTTQFCLDDILRWFAQMCAGANHIHDKRVLHRDLKSKNIFLTDNGTVKLGDFGSACILNSSKAYAHTYVGTPYYVAPEIWDNAPYNNKSDVWSLGCVLYELCTLQHPFQASSWKSLILKVCRGAYPPLPRHLPYELQYLVKQMFKTNPKDRPSLHTILTSHRVSKLLRSHFPSQVTEAEEQGRRPGRWSREEGKKGAHVLGEKSLITASTCEDVEMSEHHGGGVKPGHRKQWATEPSDTVLRVLANASPISSDSMASTLGGDTSPSGVEMSEHHGGGVKPGHRKQWATEPSDTVLRVLANASPISSDSMASTHGDVSEVAEDSRKRKQWNKDPPERLLKLLEKAELSRAFSTFLIQRGDGDPLTGPLSGPQGDATDGPELEEAPDEERLEPRSDDEDTDFEEESPCNWMDEVERMFSEH